MFLGSDHNLCEDLDFVLYLEVGDDPEGRKRIAEKLVERVKKSQPQRIEISVNGKKNRGKWPAVGKDIPSLIARHIPLADISETHQAIGNIGYVHLEWPAGAVTPGKPVSLRIHHVHSASISTDIHPYQEIHGCEAPNFFHRNKHWLSRSFGAYLEFLRFQIAEQSVESNPIKAAKRAIPLSGMVGDLDTQSRLVDMLGVYGSARTDETKRAKTLEQIKKIVHDLRIEVDRAETRWVS